MNDPAFLMSRREMLSLSVAAGALSTAAAAQAETEAAESRPDNLARLKIIDTNVSLFQWPFRRLPLDDTDALVKKLRSLGVTQAWAGSFEGVLHRDLASVNGRLADACLKYGELVPIGSVNPALPGWERDVDRCINRYKMPGVRLHPGYHGYTLDDPRFVALLERAAEAKRFVQIAVAMEDTRTQHDQLRVADVDPAPLPAVLAKLPDLRVQILNHRFRPPVLDELAKSPGICFDTSRFDGTDGVPSLIRYVSVGRVLFGTHSPFLIPEAALIRVHESGQPTEAELRAVLSENAEQLIGGAGA